VKIIRLIKILIALFVVMIGITVCFSILAAQASDENRASLFQNLVLVTTILLGLLGTLAFFFILHEAKASMEKEREAHEFNQTILGAAPCAICVWDDNYNIVDVSQQTVELFGASSAQELIGERRYDFSPACQPCGTPSPEKVLQCIGKAYAEGYSRFEWEHLTETGEPLPVEIIAKRFKRDGKIMLVSYTIDLREIKAALEKEREAHTLTQTILDSAPFVISLWDDNYNVTTANQETIKMFAVSDPLELTGDKLYNFSPPNQPCGTPSLEKSRQYIGKAYTEGYSRFEWEHITAAGEPLPAEVVVKRFKHKGKNILMSYTMDLRPVRQETQRMLAEMRRREIVESESLAKTRFLAQMSHEIRTPMNAVLGITEIQLQKGDHPPDTEEAFLRIQSSSDILLTIINDILDLSKVEAGKMEIIPEKYELASMIVDTVQLNIMRVGNKNIQFKLSIDERLPSHLIGDELRIKQILNNILSNAFKYTNEGMVTLSVGMEDTRKTTGNIALILRVQDTGQGMTEDQINNLFGIEFTRFNLSSNRFIEGSGLGMSIAYQLVKMMDGDIKVESEKGRGSVFTACIPQWPTGNTTLGKETAESLQNFEVSQRSLKGMSKLVSTPMPYGRVLAVDDVESNLYVIKELLMPYKIAVETVTNGYDATEKISSGKVYDIIFMDHMMPGMDGIEATKIIRGMGYKHPIVALTANALKNVSEMFLNNGFTGFIPKPIEINQFNSCLIRYIRDKQPSEVIEAAERQYADTKSTNNLMDNLRESFLLDARKALGILEPLIESLNREHELDNERLKSFVIQTHSMKSALYNIGQVELSKAALTLETAGKTNKMEVILKVTPRFLDSLTELVKELSSKNNDIDVADEDTDFLKAQLDIIIQACEQLDPDTANNSLNMLNQKQYSKETKELIQNISANLLYGDFDESAALAKQAASTLHTKQQEA